MNDERFTTLLDQYGNRIFQYLRKLLRSREDAEDVYQNVFVAFHAKADGVHPDAIETYLYRAAYNQAVNHIKSRQRKKETDLPDTFVVPEPDHDENPIQVRKNEAIRRAFLELSDKESSVLHMQFYDQKSYREIAEIMSMSESAVESLLVRAKRKMRTLLAQEMKQLGVITDERGEQ
jgi:RNA polymerase sigma-70 factor (ECF subfamily)